MKQVEYMLFSNTLYQDNKTGRPKRRYDQRDLLKRKQPVPPPLPGKGGGKYGWPFGHRFAFVVLLVLLGILLWKQMNSQTADYHKTTYTLFDTLLTAKKIESAKIQGNTLYGKLTEPLTLNKSEGGRKYDGIIVSLGNYDQSLIDKLVAQGVELTIDPERTWMKIVIGSLPWIMIIGIWLFLFRQMQGGPKGVFTFGKSKAKLMMETQQKATFADVAGVEEAKVELQEIIEFLQDPGKFQRLGGKIPKGALLVGPPGTGKTLLARAVAGEAGVPFFSMSGSDFVEMFVGVGASRVRDLFEQGKSNAPCIIFIDEIDAVGRHRGAGIGGGHDEREQTLNQLLVEMDGFETNEGVILIAATNRPDILDPALLRPGRFDRQIVVDWPDVKAREQILRVHAKKIQIDKNIDLESVAKGTPGMTGADLANVVNEAALLAARLNRSSVTMADFEEAKDKTMMGTARKSLVITDEEKRLTAYHEAGHVLVSKYVPHADPVHKVSIVARGRALGLTHFLPQDERHTWSYSYCITKLVVLLGGRAAEIVRIGDISNGAANDIEQATAMARKMVCEWGMSKRLGPLAFGKKDSEIFLGREIATHKDYSEETAIAIDQEIRRIVEQAQQQAESIILEHTDKLEILTAELLKREVLAGDEITRILNEDKKKSSGRRRRPQSRGSGKKSRGSQETASSASSGQKKTSADDQKQRRSQPDISGIQPTEKPKVQDSERPEAQKPEKTGQGQALHLHTDKEALKPPVSGSGKKENGKSDKKDSSGGGSGKTKEKDDDEKKYRRMRLIRLKTGGRRKVIRKAPAQKIRKIK